MKKKKKLLIVLCFLVSIAKAQEKTELEKLAKRNQVRFIAKTKKEFQEFTYKYYINDLALLRLRNTTGHEVVYNNTILNIYFKKIINAYATSTKDLSFNNYFIDANTTASTLTIGKSFRLDNWREIDKRDEIKIVRPIQKLTKLLTVYAKSNFSNNFANLSSFDKAANEYNFNPGIGAGAKFTYIFNGRIKPKNEHYIYQVRDSFVKKSVQSAIDKYLEGEYLNDIKLLSIKNDTLNKDHTYKPDGTPNNDATINDVNLAKFNKAKKQLIQKKFFEFYKTIADEELEFNTSEKFIKRSSVAWFSVEGYLPLNLAEVSVSQDIANFSKRTIKFRNWSIGATYNFLQNYSNSILDKEASFKFTTGLSLFNTNNFIANGTSPTQIQTITNINNTQFANTSSESVFIGNYKEEEVISLNMAISSLFINNSVGLSAAFEKVIGGVGFDSTNWKLGVPFSLKDKDDAPTVNFELQWRELNSEHFVGISVGYNFGKFVK